MKEMSDEDLNDVIENYLMLNSGLSLTQSVIITINAGEDALPTRKVL